MLLNNKQSSCQPDCLFLETLNCIFIASFLYSSHIIVWYFSTKNTQPYQNGAFHVLNPHYSQRSSRKTVLILLFGAYCSLKLPIRKQWKSASNNDMRAHQKNPSLSNMNFQFSSRFVRVRDKNRLLCLDWQDSG